MKIKSETFAVFSAFAVSLFLVFGVFAHDGEDHSKDKAEIAAPAPSGKNAAAVIARAERNLQIDAGQFRARLERAPSDPRAGETARFAFSLAETVEGGFAGAELVPIEDAAVSMSVTSSGGAAAAENIPAKFENGFYRAVYAFDEAGNYKVVFNIATADKRNLTVDFPVTIVRAPLNRNFWLVTIFLSLLALGAVAAVYLSARKSGGDAKNALKSIVPVSAAAALLFALSVAALAYFVGFRERRAATEFAAVGTDAQAAAPSETAVGALASTLTVPKESQILFGIKTEPISVRQITSGLQTNGVVRARPDARGVVVPPVAGRVVLRSSIALGATVGRGEQIGSVEQILDVSGQTELESQRLEIEAQQREIEARRLELRSNALALQAQQAERRAAAAQSRTQLAQAQRELRRAENLVEVGAAPRRRVEEAATSVRVAEQEVAAADQQTNLLAEQIKAAQTGQNIFRAPRVNQPNRIFPLIAPVTGTISEIKATSGQQVDAGAELLSIINLSTVLIEAQIFEADLPIVRESTRASFTSAALSGEVYTIGTADGDGRLISIGQTVDPQTRTIAVVYEVKNPLNRLRDGNFVEMTIDTSGDRKVAAIPKAAVIREQGETFVFVFAGGETFERRAVALGAEGADFYEVKSGLKENERIVVEGIYQLRATQPGA